MGQDLGAERSDRESLERRVAELEIELRRCRTWVAPGHYYSPIPDRDAVLARPGLFDRQRTELPGIDLNLDRQHELLNTFVERGWYAGQPFPDQKQPDRRYFFLNDLFSYSDGLFLYMMIRYAEPKRIVEIGSGFSSCLMLDVNELFFGGSIDLTFIDPHPQHLFNNLRDGDRGTIRLIEQPLQDVDVAELVALESGDILFVDSTHVCKTGSDVNQLLFEVFPRLPAGVYVHVHDIFWPFEYPREWVAQGRAWNEAYALQAFLMFNREFSIQLWNTYLEGFHEAWFVEHMPLCLLNRGGSLWLRREQH